MTEQNGTNNNNVVASDIAEIISRDLPWDLLRGASVLVTGASGMIPSYAVYTLLALNDHHHLGITVHGLVRNEKKARRILGSITDRSDFHLHVQDVAEPIDISGPLDLVIHGASAAKPSSHAANPVGTITANLQGTFNLLELCRAKGAKTFALMSSAEVYGTRPPDADPLIAENDYGPIDPLNPRSCYSEGKRASETIAASYAAQYGIDVTVGRFGHIYGPGMALDDGRVQADFAANVVAGQDISLDSDGSAVRTYTYVADAVAGLFYAILVGDDTAYNISDAAGLVSILQLAEAFAATRPEKGLAARAHGATDSGTRRAYSASKAQGLDSARLTTLGWRPQVNLKTGLDRTISWHEEQQNRT